MAEYTYTVYELERNNFDFGLDKYPIFHEDYRSILNDAIISHYRFREIGFSNPAQWRDRLATRMAQIMRSKYNALYKQKNIDFNPLHNIDMTETFEHEIKNESTSNATDKSKDTITSTGKTTNDSESTNDNISNGSKTNTTINYGSQFPSEQMLTDDIYQNIYVDGMSRQKLSDINEGTDKQTGTNKGTIDITGSETNDGERTQSSSGTGNTTETYSKTSKGSNTSKGFSTSLLEYKAYIQEYDLDLQVILELKDLFMNCWEV